MSIEKENTEAARYVRSLRDAVKRRYAQAYLNWALEGRKGEMPRRGRLSPVLAKAVCLNLDALI